MQDRRKHPRYWIRTGGDRRSYFDRRRHTGPLRWLFVPEGKPLRLSEYHRLIEDQQEIESAARP